MCRSNPRQGLEQKKHRSLPSLAVVHVTGSCTIDVETSACVPRTCGGEDKGYWANVNSRERREHDLCRAYLRPSNYSWVFSPIITDLTVVRNDHEHHFRQVKKALTFPSRPFASPTPMERKTNCNVFQFSYHCCGFRTSLQTPPSPAGGRLLSASFLCVISDVARTSTSVQMYSVSFFAHG